VAQKIVQSYPMWKALSILASWSEEDFQLLTLAKRHAHAMTADEQLVTDLCVDVVVGLSRTETTSEFFALDNVSTCTSDSILTSL